MRVLIGVGHPAHVHLFKYVIQELSSNGYSYKIVAVEKEITLNLLENLGFEYTRIGKNLNTLSGKAVSLPLFDFRMLKITRKFSPDIMVSTGSPAATHISKLISKPHIAFGDTEIANLVQYAMLPFTTAICTPSSFYKEFGEKHIKYNGYHELAYLHPNYFKPDPSVLDKINLSVKDKYILMRVSSADSSHDLKNGAMFKTPGEIHRAVKTLEDYGRVFISSEVPLKSKLQKYSLGIPFEEIHSFLNYAALYIGEGATLASEAGVLGVPWIFVSSSDRGYLNDQEKNYGLGYTINNPEDALKKAADILDDNSSKIKWMKKRKKLLSEKIDVTRFIYWFITNYPESHNIMKTDPSYQERFK